MKRITFTLTCLVMFFAGKAQFAVAGGDTIPVTGTTNPTQTIIYTGSCHNTGTGIDTLTWEIVSDTAQTGWTYTGVCDKNNCYDFVLNIEHTFKLAQGTSSILELHLTQGCVAGTGNVKLLLWNAADSAATVQLVTFAVDIAQGPACTNGITPVVTAQFMLYPNPATEQLKVTLPQNLTNGRVEIFNILGSKVYSEPVSSSEAIRNVDVTGFDAGFYIAAITESGKIVATKRFAKQDQ
jgi:hypothetical protein